MAALGALLASALCLGLPVGARAPPAQTPLEQHGVDVQPASACLAGRPVSDLLAEDVAGLLRCFARRRGVQVPESTLRYGRTSLAALRCSPTPAAAFEPHSPIVDVTC